MKTLGIYIHIPFCKQKCLYCDFLSFPERESRQALYFDALKREIKGFTDRCREYRVVSVFVGGGTPTLVNPSFLADVFDLIRGNYNLNADAEISIECNPGTASEENLRQYRKMGVNRLSIGLQSPKDEELRRLGRIHDRTQFERCYEDARKAGFDNINVDLMSALPGQSLSDYEENLRYVCALEPRPEHISAYSLIIEEGTPFYRIYGEDSDKNPDETISLPLPDEDTEREMYHRTDDILCSHGYHRYEISNYALDGFECLHNKRYWKCEDYIGFGLGAASLLDNVRFSNTGDFDEYRELFGEDFCDEMMSNDKYGCGEDDITVLTENARMEEVMFLGLRLTCGVSVSEFNARFNRDIFEVYGDVLKELEGEKLLKCEEGRVFLTSYGLDVSNYCMAKFLL